MERRIFGVGETVFDVVFKEDKPLNALPGGSAFNSIISLGRSVGVENPNTRIYMITESGDDHIGDIVVNFMEKNGVSSNFVTRRANSQTHVSMAFLNEENDARYEFYKDHEHACLDSDLLSKINFTEDDIILTGSFFSINPAIRQDTFPIYRRASLAESLIYYDLNFRKPHAHSLPAVMDNILENISLCNIVRGSTEDFSIVFGSSDPQEVYDRYVKPRGKILIVTDGAKPLTVLSPSFTSTYPVEKIKTVSTIGAGDNFNAGLIYGIVKYGLTKQEIYKGGKEIWDKLVAFGISFSSQVCQSLSNYIEPQ